MRIGRALGRAVTFWRRSIQARVVVSSLVLAAIVSGAIGVSLMRQIMNGIVDAKVQASVDQALRETADAQARLTAASGTHVDANTQLSQLISTVVVRGAVQGYDVLLTGPIGGEGEQAGEIRKSPGLDNASVPASLIDKMQSRGCSELGLDLHNGALRGRRRSEVGAGRRGRLPAPAAVDGRDVRPLLHLPHGW